MILIFEKKSGKEIWNGIIKKGHKKKHLHFSKKWRCLNILRVVYNKHCCNFVCPISTSILSTLTSLRQVTIVISGVMVKLYFPAHYQKFPSTFTFVEYVSKVTTLVAVATANVQ
jgi:hypothetical protein